MEPDECDHHGNAFVSYEPAMAESARHEGRTVTFSRHAIRDCYIPAKTAMVAILDEIDAAIAAHRTVFVHCWGGRGRTGTVVGCHLIRHGLATHETVIAELAKLTMHNTSGFPKIPETRAQEEFLRRWTPGA